MIDGRSRALLHEQLRDVLVGLIEDDVKQYLRSGAKTAYQIPPDVLVNYVATTFVLVLNWWVETDSPLIPTEVNDLFRGLVVPTLVTTLR